MEDDQQFCLRWNNHQTTLIQNFDTLLESGTLVDCTLAAEGKYLKAHKVVLSACSPYFEGLLTEHYDKHPVFILKDVKFKELKAMMDYMYRGEVNISQDQLSALLKAAESLQIKGLSDSKTGGSGGGASSAGKSSGDSTSTRQSKSTAGQAAAAAAPTVDIPHASSGLTIEKNKVPRQSLQQVSVSDLPEDSASPQRKGLSSREGSTSPTRKRKRLRRRSLGNDENNSMENHEASNSSDANITAPALGIAAVADDRTHADQADPVGRSALMQQLTKPADEMIQIPMEKPEPSEDIIQPKSEYLDDQESVEDLTTLDDDMNDMEMEGDNSRAGTSTQDGTQHPGLGSWHMAGDRSNASIGAGAGASGVNDEVFLAAQEAAQAQRDSQELTIGKYFILEPSFPQKSRKAVFDRPPPASHSGIVDIPSTYQCDKCKKTFARRDGIQRHVLGGCFRKKSYKCSKCGRAYTRQDTLRKHFKKFCSVNKMFFCDKCFFTSKSQASLDYHVETKHKMVKGRKLFKVEEEFESSKGLHTCSKCKKVYIRKDSLQRHEKVCGQTEPRYFCNECSYATVERKHLIQHIQSRHDPDRKLAWKCPTCSKILSCKENFDTHVNYVCNKEATFKCKLCDYAGKLKSYLANHIKAHHDAKEYPGFEEEFGKDASKHKCESCGKSFPTKRSYTYHVQNVCRQKSGDLRNYFRVQKTNSESQDSSDKQKEEKVEMSVEKQRSVEVVDSKEDLPKIDDDIKFVEFDCATCGEKLTTIIDLEYHISQLCNKELKTGNIRSPLQQIDANSRIDDEIKSEESKEKPDGKKETVEGNQDVRESNVKPSLDETIAPTKNPITPVTESRKRKRCVKMVAVVNKTGNDVNDGSILYCEFCNYSCKTKFNMHNHVTLKHKIRNVYEKDY